MDTIIKKLTVIVLSILLCSSAYALTEKEQEYVDMLKKQGLSEQQIGMELKKQFNVNDKQEQIQEQQDVQDNKFKEHLEILKKQGLSPEQLQIQEKKYEEMKQHQLSVNK